MSSVHRIVLFGPFGSAFLTFARSCWARNVACYSLDIQRQQSFRLKFSSCLSGSSSITPDKVGTPEGIAAIRDYVESIEADALIPVFEKNYLWLSHNQEAFQPRCKLLISPTESLEFQRSKELQIDLAREVGFEVLQTWQIWNSQDCEAIPANCFPVCVRPSVPTAVEPTFKAEIMYLPSQLKDFVGIRRITGHPILAQRFMPLPNLNVHGVRSETGEVISLEPFLAYRKFEGIALSARRTSFPPGIEECCRRFVKAANIVGPFHLQCLYSIPEKKSYYLEINTRLAGGIDRLAGLGCDTPALILAAFGFDVPAKPAKLRRYPHRVVNKRAVMKHIVYALRGKLTELDYPVMSRPGHVAYSLFELVFARDSIFDWGDLWGTVRYHLQMPTDL